MATQIVRDWHDRQKAEEAARVAIRIQSGTKASNNTAMGRRMMNPTYKGMVPNASGVGQRPFFINKDEAKVPLESKIAMRGGVLRTPAGQAYAKKILARRAMDIRNQDALEAGMPQEPGPLVELSEVESRTIELNQLMTSLLDFINQGTDVGAIVPDYRNLIRLMVSLSATFSEDDLTYISQWSDNVGGIIQESADQERGENALAQPAVARRENKALVTLANLTDKIDEYVEAIIPYVGSDDKTKRAAIRAAATRIFGKIGAPKAGTLAAAVAEEGDGAEADVNLNAVPPPPPTPPPTRRPNAGLPPPPAPAPSPDAEELRRLQRQREARQREEAEAAEEARTQAQRRGPEPPRAALTPLERDAARHTRESTRRDPATWTEEDNNFYDYIQSLYDARDDSSLKSLRRIAAARGIKTINGKPVAESQRAGLRGAIYADAKFPRKVGG